MTASESVPEPASRTPPPVAVLPEGQLTFVSSAWWPRCRCWSPRRWRCRRPILRPARQGRRGEHSRGRRPPFEHVEHRLVLLDRVPAEPRPGRTRRAPLRARLAPGGVPERSNGAVLKTVAGLTARRGFESHPRRLVERN